MKNWMMHFSLFSVFLISGCDFWEIRFKSVKVVVFLNKVKTQKIMTMIKMSASSMKTMRSMKRILNMKLNELNNSKMMIKSC